MTGRLDDEGLASEEEGELEGQWELDPNDPTHPDHDLSIAHGYSEWEPSRTPWLARRTVVWLIVVLIVVAIVAIPVLQIV